MAPPAPAAPEAVTMTRPGLHPDHLTDLRKSGLSDETIAAARLHSARPQDLPRLCGRPVPDGTTGLVFEYDDTYSRVKLFHPLRDGDGREVKYLQPSGSPVRAYLPPGVSGILADPSRSVCITEGEKKALKLTQEGFPTIGLGGLWNFREKELPADGLIPDLEAVTWAGRIVYLVPDSDAWTNEQVLLAVYRLARLLEARGAAPWVVKLPAGPGEAKQGADDYLVAKGPGAFRRLAEKAITLGHPAFRPWREQEKAKAREAAKPGPLPPELAGRRMHPALHFEPDGLASVGIVTVGPDGKETAEIITSTRQRYPAEAIGAALVAPPFAYPDLVNRWRLEDVARFLEGKDSPPTFEGAVAAAWDRLDSLLELGRDPETVALATWAVATYFFPAFLAFPRLDLRGERGSGKSKTLDILSAITFNGLSYTAPTTAILFRLAHRLRPTFCLDEIEGLDREERKEILSIINRGYTIGGRVPRCEGDENVVRSWDIYCPIAMAGIQGLNRVTEDRAITIVMARGKDPGRLNADVNPADPRFAEIRDVCFRLAVLRAGEVAETYRTLSLPDWLLARERQLWRPLLTIAHLADREAGDLNLVSDLLTFAREQGQDRAGLSDEAEALVSVLADRRAGGGEDVVLPGDLCEDLQTAMKLKDPPSPQRVGRWMKRLGFPRAPRCAGGKRWLVTAEALADLRKRYGET